MHLLNGEEIPSRIMLPQRNYAAATPEMRAKLEELVKYNKENNLAFVPMELGGQDVFVVDSEELQKYYPKVFYEDPKLMEVKPFTEEEPYTE